MKLSKEHTEGVVLIDAYDASSVTVAGEAHAASLLVSPDAGARSWAVTGIDALTPQRLQDVVSARPAVVLIGTGRRQRFPPSTVLRPLIEARIGFEIMDTGSACRTYNLLAAEGRKVLAALIVDEAP
ncbi:MAG: Mth938-like domain-containing protein [Candidatus Dactylopiibacterium sp.]|nr:Mth938-like domain-containing protein [Candidatus Dactylopiibacterium sp.]